MVGGVHGGGHAWQEVCMAGGHMWHGGNEWQGMCVAEGSMHGRGGMRATADTMGYGQ